MGLTVGPAVLLPLHLLLVLLQLLVGQLVEGVGRFWFRWHLGLDDWGLGTESQLSVGAVQVGGAYCDGESSDHTGGLSTVMTPASTCD